jgi:hypothetical protein
MDLNKYIALYLVKNKYCSLPGLGTLNLIKEPATRNADKIDAPKYNITFKNVGSIDDQLPHFIGLKENISTNNASNALSVFAKEVKAETADGRPFVIEGLGRFVNANGKLDFHQLSDLDLGEFTQQLPPAPTPTVIATQNNTLSSNNDTLRENHQNNPKQTISISKILVPIGLLSLLAVGAYYAYKYISNKPSIEKQASSAPVADTSTSLNASTAANDTALNAEVAAIAAANAAAAQPIVPATDTTKLPAPAVVVASVANGPAMKVAIQTYKTEAEAAKRVKTLVNLSKDASMLKADSVTYHVVINLPNTSNTAEKVIDSLRRFYNPKGNVFQVK